MCLPTPVRLSGIELNHCCCWIDQLIMHCRYQQDDCVGWRPQAQLLLPDRDAGWCKLTDMRQVTRLAANVSSASRRSSALLARARSLLEGSSTNAHGQSETTMAFRLAGLTVLSNPPVCTPSGLHFRRYKCTEAATSHRPRAARGCRR